LEKAKEQAKLEAEGGGQSLEPLEAPAAPVEDEAPKAELERAFLFISYNRTAIDQCSTAFDLLGQRAPMPHPQASYNLAPSVRHLHICAVP